MILRGIGRQAARSRVLPARPLASSNISHCATLSEHVEHLCMETLDGLKLKPDSGHPRWAFEFEWVPNRHRHQPVRPSPSTATPTPSSSDIDDLIR